MKNKYVDLEALNHGLKELATKINSVFRKIKDSYTKTEIDDKFTSIAKGMNWKPSVATKVDLEALTDNSKSDTRIVEDESKIYIYNGTSWEGIGSSANVPKATIDNDGLMSKEDFTKLKGIEPDKYETKEDFNTKVGSLTSLNTDNKDSVNNTVKIDDTVVYTNKVYSLEEAVAAVKAGATAKFDETIDIAVRLGVDPRQSDQMVRGAVSLPAGTGKTLRVAVFAKGPKAEEARKAGADIVGDEDLMNDILAGKIDFQRLIATPDMMGIVGRLGKVLGPKGLMPNPKLGTVTMDVTNAVKAAKAGQVQFRVDAVGIVHAGIGKASFDADKIAENVKAFVKTLAGMKPASASGIYLKQVSLSSTQGVGVKVSIPTIVG